VSRRGLLAGLALAVGAAASTRLWAASEEAAAPRETGLSSEGTPGGPAGFPAPDGGPVTACGAARLSHTSAACRQPRRIRVQAVDALRVADAELAKADRSPAGLAAYRTIRQKQVAAANAVLLHEFYFRGLAPQAVAVPSYVDRHMTEHMGSLSSWRADFTVCRRQVAHGLSARSLRTSRGPSATARLRVAVS